MILKMSTAASKPDFQISSCFDLTTFPLKIQIMSEVSLEGTDFAFLGPKNDTVVTVEYTPHIVCAYQNSPLSVSRVRRAVHTPPESTRAARGLSALVRHARGRVGVVRARHLARQCLVA